ncbi:MAG: copper resistance CopC family protein [Dehalococcoidia bacterium]
MKRFLTSLAACALALSLVATVLAHAEPAQVSPGLGANVTSAPGQVEIVMSQEMARRDGANDIDVFDASGAEVTRITAVIDNGDRRKISVPLPSDLAPGSYTVKWKTLSSEDGDTDEGEYAFTYDSSKPADAGRTNLREEVPVETPANGDVPSGPAPAIGVGGDDSGMSWILVAAVGIAGLALGSGATFLLAQRRP